MCLVSSSGMICYTAIESLTICRVLFTNNARIYNLEHRQHIDRFPATWSAHAAELSATLVSDTFYLYALLWNRHDRATHLVLDDRGTQSERLEPALVECTRSLVGPAREGWNHVCKRCCAVKRVGDQDCMCDDSMCQICNSAQLCSCHACCRHGWYRNRSTVLWHT